MGGLEGHGAIGEGKHLAAAFLEHALEQQQIVRHIIHDHDAWTFTPLDLSHGSSHPLAQNQENLPVIKLIRKYLQVVGEVRLQGLDLTEHEF